MPIAEDFSSIYEHQWEINFSQCAPNGLMKYTDLCNILQLTAAYHAEMGGISFTEMQEFSQAWVLSRMRVEMLRLPKWKETVTVKTWIVSLENSRSVRALEVYGSDGKKIVGCETYWAVFNTNIRRPEALALPHEHYIKYGDMFSTKERVRKIMFFETVKTVKKHKVVVSDLDIVNHVNNVKYLEWCLDTLDPALLLYSRINAFEMNFMKELMLGEEVYIEEMNTESNPIFSISREGKSCFALELELKG
ncbi:acyl-[acyl-carrier-protein] thioesterase [Flavobacterium pallidum]|uniref:Acyl-[acyl-carrier-protein] thioesterase n=1 Tax=Flavobacterium pallidum TaxID=2172098 RepID=A0A2S1SHT1_9FLAO|nr:acyl-ACP thioesterase domain-containing protein [Flavobacterium pallidum]AWI25968.1 acyl-[acyl-carrier-protein] thioesterase [Flavobacterium pallidum]